MQEMTKFAHPIELSDKELDLVAAAGGCDQSCGCGGQVGLVNVNNVLNHDNILSGNFSNNEVKIYV